MSIDITFNKQTRTLRGDGFTVFLTERETLAFNLLWPHRNVGSFLSTELLSTEIYGRQWHDRLGSIHNMMSNLRGRIIGFGLTVHRYASQGYRIEHASKHEAVRDGAIVALRARAHDVTQQLHAE